MSINWCKYAAVNYDHIVKLLLFDFTLNFWLTPTWRQLHIFDWQALFPAEQQSEKHLTNHN